MHRPRRTETIHNRVNLFAFWAILLRLCISMSQSYSFAQHIDNNLFHISNGDCLSFWSCMHDVGVMNLYVCTHHLFQCIKCFGEISVNSNSFIFIFFTHRYCSMHVSVVFVHGMRMLKNVKNGRIHSFQWFFFFIHNRFDMNRLFLF